MEVSRKMVDLLGDKIKLNFEETELRLGLPGGGGGGGTDGAADITRAVNGNGKRGFDETSSVDLKLNLSSKETAEMEYSSPGEKGRAPPPANEKSNLNLASSTDPAKPPAKAQMVGWPPVRSYRKNILLSSQKSSNEESEKKKKVAAGAGSGGGATNNLNNNATFIKVSMDGVPYLRKVDLKMYKSYQGLSDALAKMFSSFAFGNCGSQGILKDFMNESKLMDLLNSSDYVPTYEDKDGDWMLVGDVPWEMFVDSCKRLRIMKGTEAIGLAPRAVEKCKNRS